MIQILLAWLYITPVCWSWGYLLIKFFEFISKQTGGQAPAFSITCITGLSVLAVVSGLLSLFIPLGGITAQFIVLFPIIILWIADRSVSANFYFQLKTIFTWRYKTTGCLFLLFIWLILVMNSWVITHPDTIGYHLQTTRWIEDYKAVPGIVHLHSRYGYQGLWYVLCALFSFKFTHTGAATFINSTVVFWYVFFIAKEIDRLLTDGTVQKVFAGILYTALLAINFWDFGQLRLTVTSLSPDFIASIYVGLLFYLVLNPVNNISNTLSFMLIFFLSIVAIGIKLSAIAVSIFILYALCKLYFSGSRKMIPYLLILGIVSITPLLARNIISSGYLLFPSTFPDIIHYDWKFSKELTQFEKDYITAYARIAGTDGKEQIELVNKMSLPDWAPVWWHNRSYAEKFFLCSLLAVLLIVITLSGRIIRMKNNEKFLTCLFASVAGICFWVIAAPDPRFAFGFLIPIQGICLYFLSGEYAGLLKVQKRIVLRSILFFCFIVAAYSVHRCIFYFKPQNILSPAGALPSTYLPVDCGGIKINIPLTENGCGDLPVPCSYNDCRHFILRGSKITDGFKAAR